MEEYVTKEQAISVCMAIIEDITGYNYEQRSEDVMTRLNLLMS